MECLNPNGSSITLLEIVTWCSLVGTPTGVKPNRNVEKGVPKFKESSEEEEEDVVQTERKGAFDAGMVHLIRRYGQKTLGRVDQFTTGDNLRQWTTKGSDDKRRQPNHEGKSREPNPTHPFRGVSKHKTIPKVGTRLGRLSVLDGFRRIQPGGHKG